MISTSDAAKRLGVSSRRVVSLIDSGDLTASKVGGIWLVDEGSVEERLRTVRKAGGRPARGRSASEARFVLMNRTHEIAELVYHGEKREFTYIGPVLDAARAPVGTLASERTLPLAVFNIWWRGRGIPAARDGLVALLDEAGVDVPEELLYRNLGLSLSDQYWIRPAESALSWHDVNFFNNDFETVSVALGAAGPHVFGAAHPDNTSDGNLSKHWLVRDGVRYLRKRGHHLGQEPYNEVVATALHRRLLRGGEYVPYTLEGEGSDASSLCANFLSDSEEFVPAYHVNFLREDSPLENGFDHYVACCELLGVPVEATKAALARMIVCDDILANGDRHLRNFGIIRNVETLSCRPAPLFDSGNCLWCEVGAKDLASPECGFVSKPFDGNPGRQLLLVEDFSWADAGALEGFVDEAVRILGANELLTSRLPRLRELLERRVLRMADIIEWN